jgi:uncharacterized protein YndB with AHSA1/START domain
MTAAKPVTVSVTRRIGAEIERVFDAWLDPSRAGKWLFATPDGEMLTVEIDPVVGGHFYLVERRSYGDAEHWGTYLEIDRPHRLVFLFATEKDHPGGDRVTLEFTADGDGCVVTLTQVMSPEWVEYAERTEQGWTMILESLQREFAA